MNRMNTASVSLAVTPTVVSTLLSHYLNRKPLRQRPTAHLSYDEGLHLIRSFLEFASQHTVEELQAFTSQWVPHPQWVRVEEITIPDEKIEQAAQFLLHELRQDGVRKVGGQKWWQWRKPNHPLKAEWIEMRADHHERKHSGEPCGRAMLYVHGGAYFFGSVDEHRYQLQRHARKLKARVLAPRYRLAPQFPFPCGLHDCISTYLYLLTQQDPNTIILAGDSAGGGMVLAMLCVLRNQGIALPAGAILISPWVDLTHSFPSVAAENPFDYIPASGFHHKPSRAWPPPNDDDMKRIKAEVEKRKGKGKTKAEGVEKEKNAEVKVKTEQNTLVKTTVNPTGEEEEANEVAPITDESSTTETFLSLNINGNPIVVKDQIQMYATNELLSHPLVSPVMQATLGGLPPLLVMVGGGELLRDEQIYLAHKCANPQKYAPPEELLDERGRAQLKQFKPTDVQLQVWDDLCHVAPTLSFTRPAKYMYRSIAQFGAWALARAQKTGIDILDDDAISIISSSESEDGDADAENEKEVAASPVSDQQDHVGKAGDPLPPFKNHMIRQRVTRHGVVYPLAPAADLPALVLKHGEVGVIKEGPVMKWLEAKKRWEGRYSSSKAKVHQKIIRDMLAGYLEFGDGESPPPSALAGRRKVPSELAERKRTKSMGLALWALWGSKHDEMTVEREKKASQEPDMKVATAAEGPGARSFQELVDQGTPLAVPEEARTRSRRRTVVDENQTERPWLNEHTPIAELLQLRRQKEMEMEKQESVTGNGNGHLSPEAVPQAVTGVAGKRPMLDGIALPFSLKKEAETASMMTLTSVANLESRPVSPIPPMMQVEAFPQRDDSGVGLEREEENETAKKQNGMATGRETETTKGKEVETQPTTAGKEVASNGAAPALAVQELKRPEVETFVTAAEELPMAK